MKSRIVTLSMVSALALAPSLPVYGAGGAVVPGARGAGAVAVIPPIIPKDGQLNFQQLDLGKNMGQAMTEYFARQKADRDYFENAIRDVEETYNALYQQIYIPMKDASVRSSTSTDFLSIQDYRGFMVLFDQLKQEFQNKVKSLELIGGALPSANVVPKPGATVEVPKHRNLDFKPLSDYYNQRLAALETALTALTIKVNDATGVPHDVNGFAFDASKFNVITPEERRQRQAEINKLRMQGLPLIGLQDQYTNALRVLLEDFLQQMGVDEKFRFRNESDIKAVETRVKELEETFWARSYLRQKYGLPISSFHIEYKKEILNWDALWKSPLDILKFGKNTARSQKDLTKVRESFRNAVESIELKSGPVVSGIFSGNFDLIGRAASLVTAVRGRATLAEVGNRVIKLMASDVQEDLILMSPAGINKMLDIYDAKYHTDKNTNDTADLECAYDFAFVSHDDVNGAEYCPDGEGLNNIQPGLAGQFQKLLRETDQRIADLDLANQKQQALDALAKIQQSNATKILKKRGKKRRRQRK